MRLSRKYVMAKYKNNISGIRTILPGDGKRDKRKTFSPPHMRIFEVMEYLQTNTDSGISTQTAQKRRKKSGANLLYPEFKRTFSSSFIDHVKAVVSVLLALSLFVFYIFFHETCYLISSVVVSLAIIIDCVFEHISSQKFEKVRKSASLKALVKRNGKVYVTDSRNLVPGDLVYLQKGSIVPADIRLFDSNGLEVLETPLSGDESPVRKYAKDISDDEVAETYVNMAYAGSIVSEGIAWGIVCFTGGKTKLRNIKNNNYNDVPALFRYVYSVSTMLSIVSAFLGAVMLVFGMFFTSSLTTIYLFSLTVAACSFSDTVVSLSALSFSLGISQLNDEGAILRNLSSVENFAFTNALLVRQNTVFPVLKTEVETFYLGLNKLESGEEENELIKYFLICSDVKKEYSKSKNKRAVFEGKQNAVAVASYGASKGIKFDSLTDDFLITETNKSETDDLAYTLAFEDGQKYLYVKGTPEEVLPLCKYHNTSYGFKAMTDNDLNNYYSLSSVLTNDAGYILAIAKCETGIDKLSDYENDRILTLYGFVKFTTYFGIDYFKDVSECKSAGIDVTMFSQGSYMKAYNLSKNSGIFSKNEQVITDTEMDYISEEEFEKTYSQYKLMMNFTPSMCNDVVKLRKRQGDVVAITAESTNDLVIMKNSNASFVIDGESSEMIKQTSDVILKKGGFDKINKVLSISKKIYTRVHSICEYCVYNYLSMLLLCIFSGIFGVGLRTYDFLISSFIISGVIGVFIATTSMPEKFKYDFPRKRRKVAEPKNFSLSFVLALECAICCTIISKFVGGNRGYTAFLVCFFICSMLSALTILNDGVFFYKKFIGINLKTLFTILIISVFVCGIVFIPFFKNFFVFEKIAVYSIIASILVPVFVFLFNSILVKNMKEKNF